MSFRYIDSKALQIPGRMDLDELAFLATLAAQVPQQGHIVEVGAFYGRSTNAIAQGNPTAKITSIDTFENVDWTDRYANQYHHIPVFGRDAFDHFTNDLENVSPIQGFSPDCVHDWVHPIDMYFEDAIHGNPGLKRNLDFWMDHLKPGGIACGHDYTRRFPDIKTEVDNRAHHWGCDVTVVGSLWAMRKPLYDQSLPPLSDLRMSDAPILNIQTCNKKKGNMAAQNGYWCGAHLDVDRLNWVQIDDISHETGLKLEYQLGHPHFGSTGWIAAGKKAQLVCHNKARPFTRFAARLCGVQEARPFHLNYRISARQIGNGGARLSGTSHWASDGEWAVLPVEGPAVNAITIDVSETFPLKPQSAFTKRPKTLWQDLKKVLDRKVLARA